MHKVMKSFYSLTLKLVNMQKIKHVIFMIIKSQLKAIYISLYKSLTCASLNVNAYQLNPLIHFILEITSIFTWNVYKRKMNELKRKKDLRNRAQPPKEELFHLLTRSFSTSSLSSIKFQIQTIILTTRVSLSHKNHN
jgi:hypothetical protein